ncbi:MAG TPA: SRPBCC domain-containing protein [Candidatus Paceibacterota bacterium]
MEKLHMSVTINAPREKVWDTMLSVDTYPQWTTAFHPGSYYKGTLAQGEKFLFLGPDEEGGEMGMVSRVAEIRPHEFISFEHLGIVKNGVEDTESEEAKKWAPAFENYTFNEVEGGTEVVIDQDIESGYKAEFEKMWQEALVLLKELAEK